MGYNKSKKRFKKLNRKIRKKRKKERIKGKEKQCPKKYKIYIRSKLKNFIQYIKQKLK